MPSQIQQGEETLRRLDAAGLNVTAAYWTFNEESESWRFVLSEPIIDSLGSKELYARIEKALGGAPKSSVLTLSDIYVRSSSDRLLRTIGAAIETDPQATSGTWFLGNVFGGSVIPDSYVYRMRLMKRSG